MPLKRITKSVLLHEGMGDDVDRFLLEPPAVDYVENCRVDKQGVLNKRPGYGPNALTSVPDTDGDPYFLHAIGDTLHALSESGTHTYENGTWTKSDLVGFFGSKSMQLETPAISGMGHIDMLPYYLSGVLTYYIVAYEVRETSSSGSSDGQYTSTPKHVVVQRYDPSGRFLSQSRIDDARSPKLFMHPNQTGFPNAAVVMYQSTTTNQLYSRIYYPLTGSLLVQFATGVSVSPSFGMECHASLVPHGLTGKPSPQWYTRLGASADGHARYHVAVDTDNERLLILYQEDGGVKLARLNSSLIGVEQGLNIAPASSSARHEAFDIKYISVGVIYIMFGRYEPIDPRKSQVTVERRTSTGTFTPDWTYQARTNSVAGTDFYPRTYTHGSLSKKLGSTTLAWMVHDAGQGVGYDPQANPTEPGAAQESVRDRNTGVHYGMVTDNRTSVSSLGVDKFLPHHRLATGCFWFEDQLYAGVQQWFDCTPYSDDIGFNWDAPTWPRIAGAMYPRTTVIAAFDHTNDRVRPIATIDDGSSKTSEYTESELQTHLPAVFLDGGDMLCPNRVVLGAEDMSMKWGEQQSTPSWVRLGASEHPSEALCRIYRVQKGAPSGLSAAPMGDGAFLSAAIPTWFDGKMFGEMSPIDRPEIIDVRDSRLDEESSPSPPRPRINFDGLDKNQAPGTTDPNWLKLQIIVGYYDSHGNKHRSAPSETVYVDNITYTYGNPNTDGGGAIYPINWQGKDVAIYYTCPLSILPDDLEYFVEAYASNGIDDDLVLVDTSTITLGSTPSLSELCINVQLVRWVANTIDDPVFEYPRRTSEPTYTSGGVLAADAWPSTSASVVTSTRLWTIDAVNRGRVNSSKLFEDFIAPEYNSTLAINLGDERNLTAIGKLDDKVVIFEPNDIHVIYGEGPDNRGQGQDFAVHYIATDVGCQDQESVIETPAGLIFYSEPRGFYLLDRNLQVQFIGGGVEDIAYGINIVTATLVPEKAEVRFSWTGGRASVGTKWGPGPGADSGAVDRPPRPVFYNVPPYLDYTAFSYNYERGTWMVFTNHDAAAATVYQQRYTVLRRDWDIWQESTTRFDDPSGDNAMKIVTPWIKLADHVQGFRRLWRINFLGRYLSSLQDMDSEGTTGGPYTYDAKVGTGGGFAAGEIRFTAVDPLDAMICRVMNINGDAVDQTAFLGELAGRRVHIFTSTGAGLSFVCAGTTNIGSYHELDIVPGSTLPGQGPLVDSDDVTITAFLSIYEAGDINVKVYYDYEALHFQEKLFRMQDFGFDPFNNPPKRAERLQFQLSPERGRCQAVKIEITEVNSEDRGEGYTYTLGHGFEIAAIDFDIGVEESRPLLPSAVKK